MSPPSHLFMLGASARGVPVTLLAAEIGITRDEARDFLSRLEIKTTVFDGEECCDLFALEFAWHHAMNPRLTDALKRDPVNTIRAIGELYRGCHRAALLQRLDELGRAIFPDIRRAKHARQRRTRAE